MLNKITTADARKKFATIINRVESGNESFVLTRRGEAVAALISMKELKLLQGIENHFDIEDARKAKNETGEPVPWEELKKELERWHKKSQSIGGKEIESAKGGQPVAGLLPIAGPKRKRRFGSARELIKISDDFDPPLEDFKDTENQTGRFRKLRGVATLKMTTDEIMALTRKD